MATVGQRRLAELGVILVAVVWASNFVVVKAAIAEIPPVALSFLRFGIAALLLLAILRWREGSIGMPRRDLLAIGSLGALGFGLYQILWPTALQSISAGDSALLIAATPVLTALLAVAAGSDVLTPGKLAGALISFTGVAIVVGAGQGFDLVTSIGGDLLTLGAALCWAVYTAFGAPILQRHSPLRTTAWAIVAGTLVLAPIGLGQLATVSWPTIDPAVWLAVLYSAVLPAGLSNVVVFHAVWLLGPTRVTAFQFLVPAFAVVMAAIFLGEPIRAGQVLGGAVIVAGVWLTRSGRFASRTWQRSAAA